MFFKNFNKNDVILIDMEQAIFKFYHNLHSKNWILLKSISQVAESNKLSKCIYVACAYTCTCVKFRNSNEY